MKHITYDMTKVRLSACRVTKSLPTINTKRHFTFLSFLALYLCKATMTTQLINIKKWRQREKCTVITMADWTLWCWRRGSRQRWRRGEDWSWSWRNLKEEGQHRRSWGSDNKVGGSVYWCCMQSVAVWRWLMRTGSPVINFYLFIILSYCITTQYYAK